MRFPEHIENGLSKQILDEVNDRVMNCSEKVTTHCFIGSHQGRLFVDVSDSAFKCDLDGSPPQDRKKSAQQASKVQLVGRPDLAVLAGFSAEAFWPADEGEPPKVTPSEPPAAPAKPAAQPMTNGAAAPTPSPPAAAAKAAAPKAQPPKRTFTIYEVREGMEVEIGSGPQAGQSGTVVKVTGEGKDKRFRVEMAGGKLAWTDKVCGAGDGTPSSSAGESRPKVISPLMAALSGAAPAPPGGPGKGQGKGSAPPVPKGGFQAKPKEGSGPPEEFPEGTNIEVISGPHKGKCGTVLKISGEGREKKYRVQMEAGGPSTWVESVKKATRELEVEVPVVKITDLYDIEKKKLGTGAFGSVSKCTNKATGLVRAMKNIRKPMVKNIEVIWKEVAFMRRLDHPNIIRMYDTFEDARSVYLVMEICPGGELFDRIVSQGAFSEVQAAVVLHNILKGIFYMHSKKIIHRDLKPENFLLTSNEPVDKAGLKIIDFGIAHDFPEPGTMLRTKIGSAYYVAPQVLQSSYNESADMWSFGVISYLCLCGFPPFQGETDSEIEQNVLKGDYSFNHPLWDDVSRNAKDFVRGLMQMNPQTRLTAADAMAHTWIKNEAPEARTSRRGSIVANLRNFHFMNKIKRVALQVVANEMSESQIRSLRETFQALDANNDGLLTAQELRQGMSKVGLNDVPADLQKIYDQADCNHSGAIDYTEFLAAALDQKLYQQEDICWAAFRVFDKSGNGKISKDEVLEVLKEKDVAQVLDKQLDDVFKAIDTNADGEIDFKEFMQMIRQTP